MQHVLRCWERQSDGSEYKKTLRWPGLRPGPRCAEEAYSAPANPLVGGDRLTVASPRTPSLALGSSGLASSNPHSKISSDAVGCVDGDVKPYSLQGRRSYRSWGVMTPHFSRQRGTGGQS